MRNTRAGTSGCTISTALAPPPSGLRHQSSNLKAQIMDGLLLGRGVLIGPASLDIRLNYGRRIQYGRWSDFVSYEQSSFVLSDISKAKPTEVCQGSLASCVADVTDLQMGRLLSELPSILEFLFNATISPEQHNFLGLLMRSIGFTGLFRKTPSMVATSRQYALTLQLKPSEFTQSAAAEVQNLLNRANDKTGGVAAIVHVRRGNKLLLGRPPFYPYERFYTTSGAQLAAKLQSYAWQSYMRTRQTQCTW